MLDKLTVWIENHLAGPMAKIANQRHLRAVRDGIIATLPLIIVGSFFLLRFRRYQNLGALLNF